MEHSHSHEGGDFQLARQPDEHQAQEQQPCEQSSLTTELLQPTASAEQTSTTADHLAVRGHAEAAGDTSTAERIRTGIDTATSEGREIDDRTARSIATQFMRSEDPDSALGSFIACGAIWNDHDELHQELYADWQEQTPEQQGWVEALRSYCAQRDSELPIRHWCEEERASRSGIQPEIWVGSLTDYNAGLLHGMWIDADQEPDELQEQIGWILRTSPTARSEGTVAEEWAIFDHDGFCGYQVSEWSSLDTVSLVGKGIAEHGEAYAAWVAYVGDTAGELLDEGRFQDAYLGTWDSPGEYVQDVLSETGFYEQLERALVALPEDMRRHISVDVGGIAEEWEQGLHVVEAASGGVYVFSTTA